MNTKELILEKALHLFSMRGYNSVGVQEIVTTAGITKPTLYHYFGKKLGLFQAILDQYYTLLLKRLTPATQYHGDIKKSLETIFNTFVEFADEHKNFFRLRLALDFIPQDNEVYEIAQSYSRKVFYLIEELFKKAVNDHGNMRERHAIYAASFIGMVHTNIALFFNGYTSLSHKNKEDALKFFMHGIFS